MAIATPVVVAAIVGAFGMWLVQLARPASVQTPERPIVFTIDPPPGLSLAGPAASTSVPQLAVSPDGRYVAFVVGNAQGQSNLWLRALDDPQSRPLAGTDGAVDPFWSPDSRRIGFLAQGVLKLTDVSTVGSPQTVSQGTGRFTGRRVERGRDDSVLLWASGLFKPGCGHRRSSGRPFSR